MSAAGPGATSDGSALAAGGDGPSASDPGPAPRPSDALTILARELYWAGDARTSRPRDTASLREQLQSFALRLRVEGREVFPSSEIGLDPDPRLRRRAKRAVWRFGRFATYRYDRLLAELAELNTQLAERLAEAERELERERAAHREPDGER
jgi:hypothetical protein